MYTSCPHHPAPSQRPLEFKLPSFAEDEKLAFVDSVCGTLMKSRFRDGAMYTRNPRFRGTVDEPFNFLDLLKEEGVGWHESISPGRENLKHLMKRAGEPNLLQKPARSKGIALTDTTLGHNLTPFESPANLGRGSPTIPGRATDTRSNPLYGPSLNHLPLRLCVQKFPGRVAENAPFAYSTDADLHLRVKYVSR